MSFGRAGDPTHGEGPAYSGKRRLGPWSMYGMKRKPISAAPLVDRNVAKESATGLPAKLLKEFTNSEFSMDNLSKLKRQIHGLPAEAPKPVLRGEKAIQRGKGAPRQWQIREQERSRFGSPAVQQDGHWYHNSSVQQRFESGIWLGAIGPATLDPPLEEDDASEYDAGKSDPKDAREELEQTREQVAQLRKINGYLQWKLRRANKEDDEDLDAVSQAPSKPASRKARSKTGSQAGSTLGSPRIARPDDSVEDGAVDLHGTFGPLPRVTMNMLIKAKTQRKTTTGSVGSEAGKEAGEKGSPRSSPAGSVGSPTGRPEEDEEEESGSEREEEEEEDDDAWSD